MSRDTRLERLGLAHLSEDEQALKDALETEQTAREAQEAEWEKERQAIKAKRATEKNQSNQHLVDHDGSDPRIAVRRPSVEDASKRHLRWRCEPAAVTK